MRPGNVFISLGVLVLLFVVVAVLGFKPAAKNNNNEQPGVGGEITTIATGDVVTSESTVIRLQGLADGGSYLVGLNPVAVARVDGQSKGFFADDFMGLVETTQNQTDGLYYSTVRAVHEGIGYIITLVQPGKQGSDGIWVIKNISLE